MPYTQSGSLTLTPQRALLDATEQDVALTSGTKDTLGFEHRFVENISGSVPRSAATNHIIYGGHSLDVTSPGAVYALTGVDVDAYL